MKSMNTESVKWYIMKNPTDNVEIKCTEKYLTSWIARGFEVVKIEYSDNNSSQPM